MVSLSLSLRPSLTLWIYGSVTAYVSHAAETTNLVRITLVPRVLNVGAPLCLLCVPFRPNRNDYQLRPRMFPRSDITEHRRRLTSHHSIKLAPLPMPLQWAHWSAPLVITRRSDYCSCLDQLFRRLEVQSFVSRFLKLLSEGLSQTELQDAILKCVHTRMFIEHEMVKELAIYRTVRNSLTL